jgi:hypothetical protein
MPYHTDYIEYIMPGNHDETHIFHARLPLSPAGHAQESFEFSGL